MKRQIFVLALDYGACTPAVYSLKAVDFCEAEKAACKLFCMSSATLSYADWLADSSQLAVSALFVLPVAHGLGESISISISIDSLGELAGNISAKLTQCSKVYDAAAVLAKGVIFDEC